MGKRLEYMTIIQAAADLSVCTNTLRNWGASGKIKERRHPVNNYRLFKRTDVVSLRKRIQSPKLAGRRRRKPKQRRPSR